MSETTVDYYELRRLEDSEKSLLELHERLRPLQRAWMKENNIETTIYPGTNTLIDWIENKLNIDKNGTV